MVFLTLLSIQALHLHTRHHVPVCTSLTMDLFATSCRGTSFFLQPILCMYVYVYVDFHPPGSKGMSSPLTMDVVHIFRCLAKFDADFLSLHLGHIVHFCLYTRG